jgi:hypothetical protein
MPKPDKPKPQPQPSPSAGPKIRTDLGRIKKAIEAYGSSRPEAMGEILAVEKQLRALGLPVMDEWIPVGGGIQIGWRRADNAVRFVYRKEGNVSHKPVHAAPFDLQLMISQSLQRVIDAMAAEIERLAGDAK